MKVMGPLTLIALLAVLNGAAATVTNPVTKITVMMEDLLSKIDADRLAEKDAYESFVCWAKSVTEQKTASNAAAASRIEMLEAYVEGLDTNKYDLTGENARLEKDLKDVNEDIEVMTNVRNKERSEFESAEQEMKQALNGIARAIEVLGVATEGHKDGVLMQSVHQHDHKAEAESMQYAAELCGKFLSKADAFFLNHLLLGDVPHTDWKKVNRKATFKMKYKARSQNIQKTLKQMEQMFTENLEEAQAKEAASQESYLALKEVKLKMKRETEEAYESREEEMGARALAKGDSEAEINVLKTEVENDNKYMAEVADQMSEKKVEWGVRQRVRASEAAAISKALSILRDPDARDLFTKSHESAEDRAAIGFLQEQSATRSVSQEVAATLRALGSQAADKSFSRFAANLAAASAYPRHFGKVIESIDEMVSVLNEEQNKDNEEKAKCEKDRADDATEAADRSHTIDDKQELMDKINSDINDLKKEVADNKASIAATQAQLAQATENRAKEHAEYLQSDADDAAAIALIEKSAAVIAKWYAGDAQRHGAGRGGALLQKGVDNVAGEAPPPPPSTWGEEYSGRSEDSSNILDVMEQIKSDVEQDKKSSTTEENTAESHFQQLKKESEDEIHSLQQEISQLEASIGKKGQDLMRTEEEKNVNKEALDAVMDTIAQRRPGCDFVTINHAMRQANRRTEIAGLVKAKDLLNKMPVAEFVETKATKTFLSKNRK